MPYPLEWAEQRGDIPETQLVVFDVNVKVDKTMDGRERVEVSKEGTDDAVRERSDPSLKMEAVVYEIGKVF